MRKLAVISYSSTGHVLKLVNVDANTKDPVTPAPSKAAPRPEDRPRRATVSSRYIREADHPGQFL